jgi:hypothetical protein
MLHRSTNNWKLTWMKCQQRSYWPHRIAPFSIKDAAYSVFVSQVKYFTGAWFEHPLPQMMKGCFRHTQQRPVCLLTSWHFVVLLK